MATITDNAPAVQALWWLLWYGLPMALDRMMAGELPARELPGYLGHLAESDYAGECDELTDAPAPFVVPTLEGAEQ